MNESLDSAVSEIAYTRIHSNQYVITRSGKSALFIRHGRQNRLYVPRDADKALQVLDDFHLRGREYLVEKCRSDDTLQRQWDDMSTLGLFLRYDGPTPLFKVALEVHESDDFNLAAAAYAELSGVLGSLLPLHVYVQCSGDIVDVFSSLKTAITRTLDRDQQLGDSMLVSSTEASIQPNMSIFSRLEGDRHVDPAVVDALDRGLFTLTYEYPLQHALNRNDTHLEAVLNLEDEGFQLPFRLVVTHDAVGDAVHHEILVQAIEARLRESPSREINLYLQRPSLFSSFPQLTSYYDALQNLVVDLYAVDADPTQLSYFRRYLLGITQNRFASNRISVRLNERSLDWFLCGGAAPFVKCAANVESIRRTFDYLAQLVTTGSESAICLDCPRYHFCHKGLVEPYINHMAQAAPDRATEVFRRESKIHMWVIDSMLQDLMRFCAANVENATPLRVSITEEKKLEFSALYPAKGAGPRYVGGHSDD